MFIVYLPWLMAALLLLLYDAYGSSSKRNWFISERNLLFCGGSAVAGNFLGILVNESVLSKLYSFQSQMGLSWTEMSWERLMSVINGILSCMGYRKGEVFSIITVQNMACFGVIFLVGAGIYHVLHNMEEMEFPILFSTVVFIMSLAIYVLLFSFTDYGYSDRYFVPVLVWIFPLSVLFHKHFFQKSSVPWKVLCRCICLGLIVSALHNDVYRSIPANENEKQMVATWLCENGYKAGYATYWNANVMTYFSDGKLDMYSWADVPPYDDIFNADHLYQWGQKKDHWSDRPDGDFFVMITRDEFVNSDYAGRLNEEDAVFLSPMYMVFLLG